MAKATKRKAKHVESKETVKSISNTDLIFLGLSVSKESKVPAFFLSNPGLGKTTAIRKWASANGYGVVDLVTTQMTPEDVAGYQVNAHNDSDYLKQMLPRWFEKIDENTKAGKASLILFDEIIGASAYTQMATLTIIFDRMAGGRKLPDDAIIVAASNYPANLGNGFELLSPLANRFMMVNLTGFDLTSIDSFVAKDIEKDSFTSEFLKLPNPGSLTEEQENQLNECISFHLKKLITDYTIEGFNAKRVEEDGLKEISVTDMDFYINPMNKDYSSISNLNEMILNVMSVRSIGYLADVTKACAKLNVNIPSQFIMGLIGFGTGNYYQNVSSSQLEKPIFSQWIESINQMAKNISDECKNILAGNYNNPVEVFKMEKAAELDDIIKDIFFNIEYQIRYRSQGPDDKTWVEKNKNDKRLIHYDRAQPMAYSIMMMCGDKVFKLRSDTAKLEDILKLSKNWKGLASHICERFYHLSAIVEYINDGSYYNDAPTENMKVFTRTIASNHVSLLNFVERVKSLSQGELNFDITIPDYQNNGATITHTVSEFMDMSLDYIKKIANAPLTE